MQPRRRDLWPWKIYMYDDMQRIMNRGVATMLSRNTKHRSGVVGVDCLIVCRRLLSARYPSPEQRYSAPTRLVQSTHSYPMTKVF